MCGRFALHAQPDVIALQFGLVELPVWSPRYNIAPATLILMVMGGPSRRAVCGRWGLIPSWAKEPVTGKGFINARAETLGEKPAFRGAFRKQRCMVPASGYFEWTTVAGRKLPYYIRPASEALFGIAALYEPGPRGEEGTCALITTEANPATREVHDRMPAILRPADYALWLDPAAPPGVLMELLRPYPGESVLAYPVSSRVNSVKNDDEQCLAPLAGRAASPDVASG